MERMRRVRERRWEVTRGRKNVRKEEGGRKMEEGEGRKGGE